MPAPKVYSVTATARPSYYWCLIFASAVGALILPAIKGTLKQFPASERFFETKLVHICKGLLRSVDLTVLS